MIVFHHNDLDGQCAGAIVRWRYAEKDICFVEVDYNKQIPLDRIGIDEQVMILDFSFPEEVMQEVFAMTTDVIWIDHHKTVEHKDYGRQLAGIRDAGIGKAACELTWEFFFPDKALPRAVQLIGDRDTWSWKYGSETAYFNEGMKLTQAQPTWPGWRPLLVLDSRKDVREISQVGATCLRYRSARCSSMLKHYGYEAEVAGHKALCLNFYGFGSETFGDNAATYDILAAYVHDGEKFVVSLYTERAHIDVSKYALAQGGGGHRQAAGFTCQTLPWLVV